MAHTREEKTDVGSAVQAAVDAAVASAGGVSAETLQRMIDAAVTRALRGINTRASAGARGARTPERQRVRDLIKLSRSLRREGRIADADMALRNAGRM